MTIFNLRYVDRCIYMQMHNNAISNKHNFESFVRLVFKHNWQCLFAWAISDYFLTK